eukprot:scaffold186622_cov17-Tisochrysis_lutea.AAC.1
MGLQGKGHCLHFHQSRQRLHWHLSEPPLSRRVELELLGCSKQQGFSNCQLLHKETDDVTDFLFVDSAEYSRLSHSTIGRHPTHIAAGASACGYVLQKALEVSFTTCNIGSTEGNASALLFGDKDGKPLINCQDGQIFGNQRVIDTLTDMYLDTFFGKIVFSPNRQNFGGHMVTLQVRISFFSMWAFIACQAANEEIFCVVIASAKSPKSFGMLQGEEIFTPSPLPVRKLLQERMTHVSVQRVLVMASWEDSAEPTCASIMAATYIIPLSTQRPCSCCLGALVTCACMKGDRMAVCVCMCAYVHQACMCMLAIAQQQARAVYNPVDTASFCPSTWGLFSWCARLTAALFFSHDGQGNLRLFQQPTITQKQPRNKQEMNR